MAQGGRRMVNELRVWVRQTEAVEICVCDFIIGLFSLWAR